MTADPRTLFLRKTTLFTFASLLIVLIAVVFGYSHVKAKAHYKIEPYVVTFSVEAPQENLIFMAYDYGYGIIDQHTRSIHLTNELNDSDSAITQSFELSLSAWKTLRELNFIAPMTTEYTLTAVSIRKDQQQHTFTQSQLTQLHENGNRLYRLPLNNWEH